MANINISQLPNLSPLTAAAVLPVDSGGSTYHVTAANLATYVNTNAGNIIPALNNTYFLGNSTNRWANLWLGPGTLYITDSNIASNATAELTVLNGVLQINGVNQIEAKGITNGNANIAIANLGNVTITTLPGSTPLQWIFDNTGNLRCASVTEQDNLIGENNGDFFMSGTQSVKMGAGLDGNLILTVNSANVEVGAGRNYTDQFNVYGTMHAVFDNIYETGGDITADKNVYVGRLQISDQPNDLPIPGITTANTAVDFSLGSPGDTGNIYISRTIIRNGNTGVADIIPGKSVDPTIGVNTPTLVYTVSDSSIIALELRVNFQYGSTSDSDTELAAIYVTKNQAGTANVAVGTVSSTSGDIPHATYTANVNGSGLLQVYATTDATASSAYYRYRAVEFGGFFGV